MALFVPTCPDEYRGSLSGSDPMIILVNEGDLVRKHFAPVGEIYSITLIVNGAFEIFSIPFITPSD